MYIVICQMLYETWYDEFSSLQAALDYVKGYDGQHVCCRVFKVEKELEV